MAESTESKEEIITEEVEKEEINSTKPSESELPPEVDAFFKGKTKYKHPYGDWRPIVKAEPLKRKTFGDQLDLPADNWHLVENQPAPVITETKDESVKVLFKEKEIPSSASSSSSKTSGPITFKKPKITSNRQIRGASNKNSQRKREPDDD